MAEESTEKSGAHSASDPETENCQTVSRLLVKYPCRFFFAFLFVILGMTMIAGAADGGIKLSDQNNSDFTVNDAKPTLELDSHKQSSHVLVPGSPWRFLNSPCSSLTPVPMDTAVSRSVFNPPYPSGIHGVLQSCYGSSGSWRR